MQGRDAACAPVRHLENARGLAHRALDEQGLDVLPVLLQQRHQEVDGEHGVGNQLVLGHAYVPNGNTQAQHLLQLELDGRLGLGNLLAHVVGVVDGRRELARLVQPGTQQARNLLDDGVRGEENVVALRELLHLLLALVQLLQVVRRAKVNAQRLGLVAMNLVSQNAHAQLGARRVRQTDGAGEALVALRVVVLEANLQLDRLDKVALLVRVVGSGEQLVQRGTDSGGGDFAKDRVSTSRVRDGCKRGWWM